MIKTFAAAGRAIGLALPPLAAFAPGFRRLNGSSFARGDRSSPIHPRGRNFFPVNNRGPKSPHRRDP